MRSALLMMNVALILLGSAFVSAAEDLGNLSANPFHSESSSNPYSKGSPFAPNGINNPYSPYGSPFSNQSATNPFATDAPRLYDQQGNYRGSVISTPFDTLRSRAHTPAPLQTHLPTASWKARPPTSCKKGGRLMPDSAMCVNDTMKAQPFVVTPADYDPALNVLGTKVTVLASNAATQSYEITLQQGDEGTGPPLHSHDWDESFYVLKGKIEFSCAGKTVICMPGTLVHVPAGTVHGFRYGAGGGEMLELTGQGGFATKMFTVLSKEIPPGPPDIPKALEVLRQNGVNVSA